VPAATVPSAAVPSAAPTPVAVTAQHRTRAAAIAAALGGPGNIAGVEAVALTRLRVEVRDAGVVDDGALTAAGALGVWRMAHGVVHVIVGEDAAGLAAALAESASGRPQPVG